jgi:hypothetical protein
MSTASCGMRRRHAVTFVIYFPGMLRGPASTAFVAGGLLATSVLGLAGCSLGFGLGNLSGGDSDAEPADAGTGDAGTGDASDGCACLPSAPGWSVVAFAAGSDTACPAGYGPATDLVVDPLLDAAACGCSCSVATQPSCAQSSLLYESFEEATCSDASTIEHLAPTDAACAPNSFGALTPWHALTGSAAYGGTCSAAPSTLLPDAGTRGRACAADAAFAAACDTGSSCIPSPGAPFALCVMKDGGATCPPGLQGMHTAGASLQDTRGCTPCTCGNFPVALCGGSFTWFTGTDGGGCGAAIFTAPVDGLCHATPPGSGQAYAYQAQELDAACGPPSTPPAPIGSASLAGQVTICCP